MNMKEIEVTISLADLCELKDAAEVKKMYEGWYENNKKECESLRKEIAELKTKAETCKDNCPLIHEWHGECEGCQSEMKCTHDGTCLTCGQQCKNIRKEDK